MKIKHSDLKVFFLTLSFLLLIIQPIPILIETLGEKGHFIQHLILALCYAIGIFFLIFNIKKIFLRINKNKNLLDFTLIAIFLIIMIISYKWSSSPKETISSLPWLLAGVMYAVSISINFNKEEILQSTLNSIILIVLFCYLLIFVFPSIGIMTNQENGVHAGSWQGVFQHKNILARYSSLFFGISLTAYLFSKKIKWLILSSIILVLIIGSKSASGFIISILLLLLSLYLFEAHKISKKFKLFFILLLIIIPIILILSNAFSFFSFNILGKGEDLSGRIPLWIESINYISLKPYLGYGYEAFWSEDSYEGNQVRLAVGWLTAPHSHNGYIEVILQIGLIGFAILILIITSFIKLSIKEYDKNPQMGSYYIVFLYFTLFYNMTEHSFLRTNNFLLILFFILYFSLLFKKNIGHCNYAKFNK